MYLLVAIEDKRTTKVIWIHFSGLHEFLNQISWQSFRQLLRYFCPECLNNLTTHQHCHAVSKKYLIRVIFMQCAVVAVSMQA